VRIAFYKAFAFRDTIDTDIEKTPDSYTEQKREYVNPDLTDKLYSLNGQGKNSLKYY
jgi:hypothetical protein